MQKDNSTLRLKVSLRQKLLAEIESPIVMETHGGYGVIYERCYRAITDGVVFEKDPRKSNYLSVQRPAWAVYETDCVAAIAGGVGAHLPINFVDIDPYGEPWPVIEALFSSQRPWPDVLGLVVNDGLRQKLKTNSGWSVGSLAAVVERYGNDALYDDYLEICRELIAEKAAQVGYSLSRWAGYYCGHAKQMIHYAAVLKK